MEFICDRGRHLVCLPFSVPNLHAMAEEFGIKRCWFHGGRLPHYDIPEGRVAEIVGRQDVRVAQRREVLAIILGGSGG